MYAIFTSLNLRLFSKNVGENVQDIAKTRSTTANIRKQEIQFSRTKDTQIVYHIHREAV